MLGAILGASFAPSVFDHLGLWALSLTGLVAYLLTLGGAVYLYFRQVVGLDRATAFYSAMPGGLVEMVTQGSEKGGDERMIALIHVVRIFLVVLSLPFIIQFVTGQSIGRGASSYVPFSSLTADSLVWFIGSVVLGVTLATILKFPARFFLGPMIVSAVVHFWVSPISDCQV
jgi:uncharacterized protein